MSEEISTPPSLQTHQFSKDVIDWTKRIKKTSHPHYDNLLSILKYRLEIAKFDKMNRQSRESFYVAMAMLESGIASILIKEFGNDGFGNTTIQKHEVQGEK